MATRGDYAAGLLGGTVVSLTIAPVMTVADLAIIRSQFARESLGTAVKGTLSDLFTGKKRWHPALSIMVGVYGSTYVTGNVTRLVCKDLNVEPHGPVAVAVSVVNAVAIALKDRAYAVLYKGGAQKFPFSSLLLFGTRDSLTITASFVVRKEVQTYLDARVDPFIADVGALLGVPMLAQAIATPFHILALDRYERPVATFGSRIGRIVQSYGNVALGRVLRLVPAFAVGGYLNDMALEQAYAIEDSLGMQHEEPKVGIRRRTTIV